MRHSRFNSAERRFVGFALVALLTAAVGCGDSLSGNDDDDNGDDNVAPTVNSTNPLNGAIGVAVITATFSEAMNASTINTGTFSLIGPGNSSVNGTVTYDAPNSIARFIPTNALASGTAYTARITRGAKDVAGNELANQHEWSFTKSVTSGNQTMPALGSIGGFVILAGSTVTNTGASILTGDLGVSPGSSVTGFPPGTLIGTMYLENATSATAKADLTIAYDDVSARSLSPVTVAGNLGGLTLPPGLYKSTSSLSISSGDLTLDAMGDANAVFMFQMASTLTTSSGRGVILTGGAKASNVFWQVGSSATLGTTSGFKGTIMANQSVTLNTGATLTGWALARTGAVTLASNAVVLSTP